MFIMVRIICQVMMRVYVNSFKSMRGCVTDCVCLNVPIGGSFYRYPRFP